MTEALATRNGTQSLEQIMSLGDVFVASGYFKDARQQAQAVVKIMYGQELGLSPIVSMMGLHIVEGKPELSSNIMAALVKQSGRYDYKVVDNTDGLCVLAWTQDGEPVGNSSFSIGDAKRARLVKEGSGWTKYPKSMLFARALSSGVRTFCPDVSVCPIYATGEISGDGPTNDTKPPATETITVEPVAKPEQEPEPEQPTEGQADRFIDLGEQRALHRLAREEFSKVVVGGIAPNDKQIKETFRHWLEQNGYANSEGVGSTKTIPLSAFKDIQAGIREHAETMKGMAAHLAEA